VQNFVDSTDLIPDGAALATRMRRDGYLFLRGLVPPDAIRTVQRQVAEIARADGWLRRDQPIEDAIADPAGFCIDPEPTYLHTLRRINHLEDYHALKHHPALITLFERMLGGPLIDCPMQVGPLQVAAGSHTQGVFDFHIGAGAGGIEIVDPLEGRWVSDDFAVGDVLIFHSMVVHKGVPNRSDKLRMSMDVRYQLASEPFNLDNANADGQPLSWDDIYAGWRSQDLQYYWQKIPLVLKDFDRTWFDKRDALGFALGEAGDPRARSVLQRIVARDADAAKRERAQRLLDAMAHA